MRECQSKVLPLVRCTLAEFSFGEERITTARLPVCQVPLVEECRQLTTTSFLLSGKTCRPTVILVRKEVKKPSLPAPVDRHHSTYTHCLFFILYSTCLFYTKIIKSFYYSFTKFTHSHWSFTKLCDKCSPNSHFELLIKTHIFLIQHHCHHSVAFFTKGKNIKSYPHFSSPYSTPRSVRFFLKTFLISKISLNEL